MSLRTSIGAIGNLLDERPRTAAGWRCRARCCRRRAGAAARHRARRVQREHAVARSTRSPRAPTALERAVDDALPRGLAGGLGRLRDRDPVRPRRRRRCTLRSRRCWRPRPCTRTWCARAPAPCAAWWSSRASRARRCSRAAARLRRRGGHARTWRWTRACERLDASRLARYVEAVGKGLLKICSKMGISTVQSYRGAQIFEAVGLGAAAGRPLLPRHRVAGRRDRAGRGAAGSAAHATARSRAEPVSSIDGGEYRLRRGRRAPRLESGRRSSGCSAAVRDGSAAQLRARTPTASMPPTAGCDAARPARAAAGRPAVPLEEVEPSAAIVAPLRDRRDEPRLALPARRTRRWRSR